MDNYTKRDIEWIFGVNYEEWEKNTGYYYGQWESEKTEGTLEQAKECAYMYDREYGDAVHGEG